MNSSTTKKTLTLSIISIFVCIAALVGATYAWFTDNATTNVNTIHAGTLDIKLLAAGYENAESLENKTLAFVKEDGTSIENALFEPGARFKLQDAWLYNAGNLHAKYQVVISGIDGSSDLAQYLDVIVAGQPAGKLSELAAKADGVVKEGQIAPGAFATFGTIELSMAPEVGNEAQGNIVEPIEGITITVYATQATVESDSNGSDYDELAKYDKSVVVDPYAGYPVVQVTNQKELDEAIAAATEKTVYELATNNYTFHNGSYGDKQIIFKGTTNVIIDATGLGNEVYGNEFIFDNVTIKFPETSHKGITHTNKVIFNNCTLSGTQTLYAPYVEFNNCTFDGNQDKDIYYVWTYGIADAIFNDCTFNTSGKAILCYHEGATTANVTLSNCVFNSDKKVTFNKAAVEVGTDNHTQIYNLTFTNCTANDFATNNSTSSLWGNKNSMDANCLNVVIDGVYVY